MAGEIQPGGPNKGFESIIQLVPASGVSVIAGRGGSPGEREQTIGAGTQAEEESTPGQWGTGRRRSRVATSSGCRGGPCRPCCSRQRIPRVLVYPDAVQMSRVQVVEIAVRGQQGCAGCLGRGGNPDIILAHRTTDSVAQVVEFAVGAQDVRVVDVHPDQLTSATWSGRLAWSLPSSISGPGHTSRPR